MENDAFRAFFVGIGAAVALICWVLHGARIAVRRRHLPATSESAPSNVFHPGLRGQIREARTRRERLHNTEKSDLSSWQDASGKTWIDLGDGTCMRSASDTRGRKKLGVTNAL